MRSRRILKRTEGVKQGFWEALTVGDLKRLLDPFTDECRLDPPLRVRYRMESGEGLIAIEADPKKR